MLRHARQFLVAPLDEVRVGNEPQHREHQKRRHRQRIGGVGYVRLGSGDPVTQRDTETGQQTDDVDHQDDLTNEVKHGFAFFCRGTRTVTILTHIMVVCQCGVFISITILAKWLQVYYCCCATIIANIKYNN